MKLKRALALLMTTVMLFTMMPTAVATGSYSDVQGHWASSAIGTWDDRGVIQGWDGKFNPNNSITRGDMAVVIDRIMGYSSKAANTFLDLGDAYYTDAVLRVAQAGVMQGYQGKLRPESTITREESIVMLGRAFGIEADTGASVFADDTDMDAWARSMIAAFAAAGYVQGRSNNQFAPKASVTRAEIMQMLDNMVSDYITSPGVFTPKGDGIVIVKAPGVTLKNATIKGNLILAGAAGTVVTENTSVAGKVVGVESSSLSGKPTTPATDAADSSSDSSSSSSSEGTTVPSPGAYPLPKGQETSKSLGVFDYDMTYFVSLTAQTGAEIYYEVAEGANAAATPTTGSAKFDTYQYRQIEITQPAAPAKGQPATEKVYNIKAIAVKNGSKSAVSNWNYTVKSNPHGHLKVGAMLDWNGNPVPDVTLIQDYDSDKMYLLNGSERAMVLDAGYFDAADPADLYAAARSVVGEGKPIDLIIGHPHPDHVQMTHQFLNAANKALGAKVYVNERGIEVLRTYVKKHGVDSSMFENEDAADAAYNAQLATLGNGDVYEMGNISLDVVEMPGHQSAGIMLFDRATGNLFSTDQIGNNRAHITDSFWMQFNTLSSTFFADAMDIYLSNLQVGLDRIASMGAIKCIMTGHNDVALDGQNKYLANLEAAVQKVVDQGEASLTPSLRTLDSFPGYKENTRTVFVGNRLSDINWAGINVHMANFLSEENYRSDPRTIAELSNISVRAPGQTENLLWADPNFGVNVNWAYPLDGTVPTRKANLTFTATVGTSVSQINLIPTAAATNAKSITINGQAVQSGKTFTASLPNATNSFEIVVTAPNGTDTKTYTVVVNKSASAKAAAPATYTDYDNYRDPFFLSTAGTYTVSQYMALFSDTAGATVKYTTDGSDPKTSGTAKVFDQTKFKAASGAGGAEVASLIAIADDTSANWSGEAKTTTIALKAYASKSGLDDSDVKTFTYTIDRMAKTSHKSRVLYDEGSLKVWQIIDYDSDKMYLIKGASKALLIDAGMAPSGADDLYEYAKTLTGMTDIDLYISHGHPDHVTQIGDFVKADRNVYMHKNDFAMAKLFINDKSVTSGDITFIDEGFQFDLGGVVLDNYFVPGHTAGHMVLLDKANDILYSSDAIGCNRRSVADSLTLIANDVRVLLSSVQVFRDKLEALDDAGEIDLEKLVSWTGHDDYEIQDIPGHLAVVIEAAQNIVDYGPEKAMRDSVRNTGGSDGASFAGDRYAKDGTGHFICMNGKKATVLNGQDYKTVANLANVSVTVAGQTQNLMKGFSATHTLDSTNQISSAPLSGKTTLVAEVPHGTTAVDIYPTAMATNAAASVNGMTPDANGKVNVTLNNGYKAVTIEVTAPDNVTKERYDLIVRTEIDASNPYKTLHTGTKVETVTLFDGSTRTFTSYVPDGARESNAGVFVLPENGQAATTFNNWKTLADATDTQAIDDTWTKQQEKFIVISLDGLTYGTSAEERAADIDYVNQVYAAASGRSLYCIHEAKNYMVGYGVGGTIAQMAAMDQTAVWAGLTTVGAGAVDGAWLAEHNAAYATSLNGYSDANSTILKNTLPLPVWIINDSTTTDAATLNYWKSANKITEGASTVGDTDQYVRTDDLTEAEYAANRDKQAYRIWESAAAPADLESTIWNDFLFGVRRWMADPGGDLRMTLDPIADLHMTRKYEDVDGWMREWYVYVPSGVNTSTSDVPVVFAMHGYTLNGAVYAGQSDWHKVADANNFIVVFPSAINGNLSENGNAPFPAWNIAQDPTRMDDIAFVKHMLRDLDDSYDIDLGRVYVTGHSWGSQMSHVLAMSNPQMFAAAAPLSGFVFRDAVYDSLDADAMAAVGGVPIYLAAGTEGSTEKAICPVPLTATNSSGRTLQKWFELNAIPGSIDWDTVSKPHTDAESAFTPGGPNSRWYTLTYENGNGVPMLRAEIVDYMPHATMSEHSARVWADWFSHYTRAADGSVQYTA